MSTWPAHICTSPAHVSDHLFKLDMNCKYLVSLVFGFAFVFKVSVASSPDFKDAIPASLKKQLEGSVTEGMKLIITEAKSKGVKPVITSDFLKKRQEYANIIKNEYEQMQAISKQVDGASCDKIQSLLEKLEKIESPLEISSGTVKTIKEAVSASSELSDISKYRPLIKFSLKAAIDISKDLHQDVLKGKADELVNLYYTNQFSPASESNFFSSSNPFSSESLFNSSNPFSSEEKTSSTSLYSSSSPFSSESPFDSRMPSASGNAPISSRTPGTSSRSFISSRTPSTTSRSYTSSRSNIPQRSSSQSDLIAIIGAILGAVLLAVIAALIIYFRKKSRENVASDSVTMSFGDDEKKQSHFYGRERDTKITGNTNDSTSVRSSVNEKV